MEGRPEVSLPTRESVRLTLDALGLTGDFRIDSLPGSYSNFTRLVTLADDEAHKIVLRRYNPANYEEGHNKPACEFHALEMLHKAGVPAPRPLLLDETGDLLGLPGIVTAFAPGKQVEPPTQAPLWGELAAKTARMLARIHRVPVRAADKPWLMDDNTEVAWFIKDGAMPDYMRRDPGRRDGLASGQHALAALAACRAALCPLPITGQAISCGRMAKSRRSSTGKRRGYGHPAADVAYCRMEYYLEGLPDAAEEFLRVYENATGWKATDLPLFELAASARVMTDPRWLVHTRPHMEARYRRFVANANAGLLAG